MSNVALNIGGRDYAVACAAGEEDHVRELGLLIDDKLGAMPGAVAQSETRSLLFAALLLADELHELRAALAGPSAESVAESGDRQPADGDAPSSPALARIAERLENLAKHLEAPAPNA